MDLLYDQLVRARATGAVFARTVAEPPWGLRLGGSIQLAVHTVVRGRGYLWLDTPTDAVELSPGTVALVRGGPDHPLGPAPGAACLAPAAFRARPPQADPPTGHDGSPASALSGCPFTSGAGTSTLNGTSTESEPCSAVTV